MGRDALMRPVTPIAVSLYGFIIGGSGTIPAYFTSKMKTLESKSMRNRRDKSCTSISDVNPQNILFTIVAHL